MRYSGCRRKFAGPQCGACKCIAVLMIAPVREARTVEAMCKKLHSREISAEVFAFGNVLVRRVQIIAHLHLINCRVNSTKT